jgi:hypothetical protein
MIAYDLFGISLFLCLGVGIFWGSFYQKKGALRRPLLILTRIVGLGFIIWSLISLAFYFEGSR